MSGGMIDKWTTDALHKATIRHSIKLDGAADDYGDSASLPNDNVQRALNMDDLQGAFIILGVGNLAAAALLAAEIIFSRGRLAKFMKHKKNSFHENEEDGQKESLSFHNILPCWMVGVFFLELFNANLRRADIRDSSFKLRPVFIYLFIFLYLQVIRLYFSSWYVKQVQHGKDGSGEVQLK